MMPLRKRIQIALSVITVAIIGALVYIFPSLNALQQQLLFTLMAVVLMVLSLSTIKAYAPLVNIVHLWSQKQQQPDVLVVDDNPANRRITGEYLRDMSLLTLEATNGKQALALYQRYPLKLILMDLEMDDMDGMEATRRIRIDERDTRIPIVAISAHNSTEKKLQALAAGFDDYLTKPVDDEVLTETVSRWLDIPIRTDAVSKKITERVISLSKAQPEPVDKTEKTSLQVVDIGQSLSYSRNDKALAKDMLQMLLTMITDEKAHMVRYFEEQKWEDLGHLVHKLNGGSCYCGVPQLQKDADLVDKAIQAQQFNTASAHFPTLLKSMGALQQWQEQHDLDIIFE